MTRPPSAVPCPVHLLQQCSVYALSPDRRGGGRGSWEALHLRCRTWWQIDELASTLRVAGLVVHAWVFPGACEGHFLNEPSRPPLSDLLTWQATKAAARSRRGAPGAAVWAPTPEQHHQQRGGTHALTKDRRGEARPRVHALTFAASRANELGPSCALSLGIPLQLSFQGWFCADGASNSRRPEARWGGHQEAGRRAGAPPGRAGSAAGIGPGGELGRQGGRESGGCLFPAGSSALCTLRSALCSLLSVLSALLLSSRSWNTPGLRCG